MRRKILDESLLHHIIMETINDYLNEDGAMGGGATAGATSDSADRQGAFVTSTKEARRFMRFNINT